VYLVNFFVKDVCNMPTEPICYTGLSVGRVHIFGPLLCGKLMVMSWLGIKH
jgi:hypothetical protein